MRITYETARFADAYGFGVETIFLWREFYIRNDIYNLRDYFNGDGDFIVAKDGNKIVGVLDYCRFSNNKLYIESIYVLKEYHGLGIGKNLFKIAVLCMMIL